MGALRAVRVGTVLCLVLAVLGSGVAPAVPSDEPATRTRAGVAVVDASWHIGASSGQYSSGGAPVGDHGIDPYQHSTRKAASYGLQSRTTVRALVIEDVNHERVAIVSNDMYIPQDLLARRVSGLLAEHDRLVELGLEPGPAVAIGEGALAYSSSHSHGSPYYSSPSWGVWAFQDIFDLRFFEYMASRMADAVIEASRDLRPVRMGGATSRFNAINSHSYGPQVADDGTPAGQPWDHTTQTVSVVRFDDVTDPEAPDPLATWVVFGMHPEFTNRDDLVSGDFNHAAYRILDREIGGVTLMSQMETGTAGPHKDIRVHGPETRREFQDMGFSQMDRAARIFADAVGKTYDDIEQETPEIPSAYAPFATDFTVAAASQRFAPPTTRPYPGVSNCRTERAFQGDPGVPVVGLPTCEFPFGDVGRPVAEALGTHELFEQLKEAGVPIPESVTAPSYTGLQETIALHLQALRLGSIGVTLCPCEQFTDQALNIISRLNRVEGDFWFGFDWTRRLTPSGRQWCVQNPDTTWTCANPRNPHTDLAPVPDRLYKRMLAQIYNDARGWDAPEYAPYAEAEPYDPSQVKGNFTHEELTAHGFDLVLPLGMGNDYWGYVPSYREYQASDHYRKALNGLGPHGQDFLATRLSRMAASLNGGPPVELDPLTQAYQAEHHQNQQRADALGRLSRAYTAAYEATLPADGGTPRVVEEPSDLKRFDAATVRFVGGSNFTDLPDARVERLDDGQWVPFGDTSGDVQLKLDFPQDEADLGPWRAGDFEWIWTASLEAFNSDVALPDASGVTRTQTPTGVYRFVIEGTHRGTGEYRLESAPFEIRPWNGITVSDLQVTEDGSVSFAVGPVNVHTFRERDFVVGPVDYPDTYDSPFRYFRGGRLTYHYNLADPSRWQQFCARCTFRPWADTSEVTSAHVTVVRADGTVELMEAHREGDRWIADTALADGDEAYVDRGGIVDTFGEVNDAVSASVGG